MKQVNENGWDREGSTYVRIITFTDGKQLTGYSKKIGNNERRNPVDGLTNWILRDYIGGYLDARSDKAIANPTSRIDYYLNQTQDRIISLTYAAPDWTQKAAENKKLFNWINRFYAMIRAGKPSSEIENFLMVRTRERNRDELDYSVQRFFTLSDLNFYFNLLLEQKRYTAEAIHHFYREYKLKWFSTHGSVSQLNTKDYNL
jgi:hypothetical protein